ncbi:MAG: 50S ribosomal protein L18e [Candidatus Odinarchaeota archaeon]
MVTNSPNEIRQQLLIKLKRQSRNPGGRIWRTIYEKLQSSRQNRVSVNVGDLQRHFSKGRIMVVPGKVLSDGIIEDKLEVAAFTFSAQARKKIEAQGGKCLTLEELMEKNPTGKEVMLVS